MQSLNSKMTIQSQKTFSLLIGLIVCLLASVQSQPCSYTDPATGKFYDYSSLTVPSNQFLSIEEPSRYYWFNICSNTTKCNGSGACFVNKNDPNTLYNTGYAASPWTFAAVKQGSKTVIVLYYPNGQECDQDTSDQYTTEIQFNCDSAATRIEAQHTCPTVKMVVSGQGACPVSERWPPSFVTTPPSVQTEIYKSLTIPQFVVYGPNGLSSVKMTILGTDVTCTATATGNNNTYNVQCPGSYKFPTAGTFSIVLTASDGYLQATYTYQATVINTPCASVSPSSSYMSSTYVGTPFTVTLSSPNSDSTQFLVTINWGDGASNTQAVVPNNGFPVSYTHKYQYAGSSPLTMVVSTCGTSDGINCNSNQCSTVKSVPVNIVNVPPSFVTAPSDTKVELYKKEPLVIPEFKIEAPNGLTSVTVTYEDGSTNECQVSATSTQNEYLVKCPATEVFTSSGQQQVTITATDGYETTTHSYTVTINDSLSDPVSCGLIVLPNGIETGESVSVIFTPDPQVGKTDQLTIKVEWGNGFKDQATTRSQTVTLSHTYDLLVDTNVQISVKVCGRKPNGAFDCKICDTQLNAWRLVKAVPKFEQEIPDKSDVIPGSNQQISFHAYAVDTAYAEYEIFGDIVCSVSRASLVKNDARSYVICDIPNYTQSGEYSVIIHLTSGSGATLYTQTTIKIRKGPWGPERLRMPWERDEQSTD